MFGWDVGIIILIYGSRPVPFPARSRTQPAPYLRSVRRGKPRLFDFYIITESPVFTGLLTGKPALFPITERAGLLLLTAPFGASLPFNAGRSLVMGFACRQRHIHVRYSTRAGQMVCITWSPGTRGFASGIWVYPTLPEPGRR